MLTTAEAEAVYTRFCAGTSRYPVTWMTENSEER